MSRTIKPFDPSLTPGGSTFETGLGGNYGYLVFFNLSPYELLLTLSDGSEKAAPAWWARLFVFDQAPCPTIKWQIQATPASSNPPLSMCWGEAYDISEDIGETYPQVLVRQTNIGNQVSTTSSNSVQNDGNSAGTVVVEGTPSGAATSQLKLTNDGTAVLGGGHISIDAAGVVAGASIAAGEITGTLPAGQLGAGYGAANLGAGTVPAGVVVPGANVSGAVANATNATNATNASNATTAGDGANGVHLAIGDSGGRLNMKPDVVGTTGRGFSLATRDSGGVLHTVAQADADGSNALFHGVADSASAVPATGITAGTLPAGVVVPAANVSGKVASASAADTATSATSATNAGDGASGSYLAAQDGGSTINIKPTVGPRGLTVATRDSGGTLHNIVSANNDASSVVFHGVADIASAVPATGITAGAIPAGVTLPAAQVTAGALPILVKTTIYDGALATTRAVQRFIGTTDPSTYTTVNEGDEWDAV